MLNPVEVVVDVKPAALVDCLISTWVWVVEMWGSYQVDIAADGLRLVRACVLLARFVVGLPFWVSTTRVRLDGFSSLQNPPQGGHDFFGKSWITNSNRSYLVIVRLLQEVVADFQNGQDADF
jgi:hypothetical protein